MQTCQPLDEPAAGREPGLPIMTSLEERMNILRRAQLCAVCLLFFFFNCAQATASPVLETELQHLKFAFTGNTGRVRAAIEKLEWTGISDPDIFDVAAKRLEANYTSQSSGDVDLNAWLAKGIALSGNPKYQPLFDKILAMKTRKRKLRNYVALASQQLVINQRLNPIIAKDNHLATSQEELDKLRIRNMLESQEPELISAGTRRIYHQYVTEVELTDMVHDKLAAQYKSSTNPEHLDAIAYMCRTLAESGNSKYKPTLELIAKDNAAHKKVRKYAKKYADYLM